MLIFKVDLLIIAHIPVTVTEKAAILAGSTGLVGGFCLDLLLENSEYRTVHSISRKTTGKIHPRLQEILTDFDSPFYFEIPEPEVDVFCCLGTTIAKAGSKENFKKVDYEYVVKLAEFARQINAKNFSVVSALGSNKNSFIFYNRVKGEMEEALKNLGLYSLHIFRPSLLSGGRKEKRFGEETGLLISSIFSGLFVGGFKKYKPIHGKKVANAMIHFAGLNKPGIFYHESDEIQDSF